jgi:hypothetical protein
MSTLRSTPLRPGTGTSPVPAASRASTQGWRDPRLLAGVVIVAVCVLLGARVMAAADDTVAVWSARHDLTAGSTVARSDLAPVRVHFSGTSADRYLVVGSALAPGSRVAHDLAAGELVPSSAVITGSGPALVEVPLSLSPDDLPASVHRGATVDVWVTPKVAAAGDERPRARLALDDVVVVDVPRAVDSLAPRTTQQVIVGVDAGQAQDLAEALGQLVDGRVVLTRQAGS